MLAISFLVSTDGVTHLAVDEGRNVAQRTQNTDYSSIEVSHANYTYKSVHSLMSIMQPLAYEVTRVSAAETLSDLRAQYQKQEEPFMKPKNEKSYPLWSKVCDTRSNSFELVRSTHTTRREHAHRAPDKRHLLRPSCQKRREHGLRRYERKRGRY